MNKIGITKIQAVIVIAVIVIAATGGLAYYLLSQLKPAAQVVEITWWHFGGIGSEHVYARWLVEQFNKEHPNIKVKWEHKSWMQKRDILISSFITGTAPDIITQDTGSLGDFVEMGYYVPLDNFIDWDKVKALFVPEVIETVHYKGHYWGVPTYFDGAPFIAINVDAFKKAGLVDSQGNILIPTTWEELTEYAKKCQEGNPGMVGFSFPVPTYNDMVMFEAIVYQNGGRWLDPETGKPVVNDSAWKAVAQLYHDLVRVYKVSPESVVDLDYYKNIMAFLQGQSCMALGLTWFRAIQSELNITTPFKWVMAPFPMNTGKNYPRGRYSPVSMIMDATTTFYILSVSRHRNEAWEFIKWVALNGYTGKWGPGAPTGPIYGRTPATYDQWKDPKWKEVEPYLTKLFEEGKLFQGAQPTPTFRGIIELLEKHLPDAVRSVILEQKTADEAFKDLQQAAEKVLGVAG